MSGHDGRRGFIHHTTVKQEYRGQGIGKKLVASALAALEAEGIHKVALVAFEKNVSGNIFWEKAGFNVRDDLIYRNKNIHELKKIGAVRIVDEKGTGKSQENFPYIYGGK